MKITARDFFEIFKGYTVYYQDGDKYIDAIICGYLEDYLIIGSILAMEFCVKEFSDKVNIDKTIISSKELRSFRMAKLKNIRLEI